MEMAANSYRSIRNGALTVAVVYQKNKGSGIVYAYESQAFWVKEKQQSRAKRKCIGKVDPETGQIIPTRKKKQ